MTKLETIAFDLSDEYCACNDGDECVAQAFMNGYMQGFKEACELEGQRWDHVISSEVNNPQGQNEQLIAIAKRNAARVRSTYEEEAT